MRLLNVNTMKLKEYFGPHIPEYAILSHCWGTDEVTFADINGSNWRNMRGATKIEFATSECRSSNINYIWIDTCCIDKGSSAELSEAINSMFEWYSESTFCYAYLEDVSAQIEEVSFQETIQEDIFRSSRWFTRGWTLQELIAPTRVKFFDMNWSYLGDKLGLSSLLSKITTIPEKVLADPSQLRCCSVARKMSWAAGRETTRVEDIAYSLLGLFEVNMPLLYGEGRRAFIRLQEEILKETDDHSLFAWGLADQYNPSSPMTIWDVAHAGEEGVLAEHPADFVNSANVVPFPSNPDRLAYSMTNRGLRIELPFLELSFPDYSRTFPFALLDCHYENDFSGVIGICLRETETSSVYTRALCLERKYSTEQVEQASTRTIYIIKQSGRTISYTARKYLLRWESLRTRGHELLSHVSTPNLDPGAMAFELGDWGRPMFVFCNYDKENYFAVICDDPTAWPDGDFKLSIQIVPKPRGLGINEWLEDCEVKSIEVDMDHHVLQLPFDPGSSVPLTISARVTGEILLNREIYVLEIGVVSGSDLDSGEA